MSFPRSREHLTRHLVPLPEDRTPPLIFIHQAILEREQGWALAGLLITDFPRRARMALTPHEAAIVERVQVRLLMLRRSGRLPDGDIFSIWTTPAPGGNCTPLALRSERWLRQRMALYAWFALRLPPVEGVVH